VTPARAGRCSATTRGLGWAMLCNTTRLGLGDALQHHAAWAGRCSATTRGLGWARRRP